MKPREWRKQVSEVAEKGAKSLHVDVMDGHFVPNISLGPVIVKGLRNGTKLDLDCHLMVSEPGFDLGCNDRFHIS